MRLCATVPVLVTIVPKLPDIWMNAGAGGVERRVSALSEVRPRELKILDTSVPSWQDEGRDQVPIRCSGSTGQSTPSSRDVAEPPVAGGLALENHQDLPCISPGPRLCSVNPSDRSACNPGSAVHQTDHRQTASLRGSLAVNQACHRMVAEWHRGWIPHGDIASPGDRTPQNGTTPAFTGAVHPTDHGRIRFKRS